MVTIDYQQLHPDILNNLLREIVLREGTDYGASETPTEVKIEQLRQALIDGTAVIIYDATHNHCDVVPRKG